MDARRACVVSGARRPLGSSGALHGLGTPMRGNKRCIGLCHCFSPLAPASAFALAAVASQYFFRRDALSFSVSCLLVGNGYMHMQSKVRPCQSIVRWLCTLLASHWLDHSGSILSIGGCLNRTVEG